MGEGYAIGEQPAIAIADAEQESWATDRGGRIRAELIEDLVVAGGEKDPLDTTVISRRTRAHWTTGTEQPIGARKDYRGRPEHAYQE